MPLPIRQSESPIVDYSTLLSLIRGDNLTLEMHLFRCTRFNKHPRLSSAVQWEQYMEDKSRKQREKLNSFIRNWIAVLPLSKQIVEEAIKLESLVSEKMHPFDILSAATAIQFDEELAVMDENQYAKIGKLKNKLQLWSVEPKGVMAHS